jgi:preprotein translocase subunit SecE
VHGKALSNGIAGKVLATISGKKNMIAKTKEFLSEIRVELSKSSWPWNPEEKGVRKYKELIDSTLIVVIAMILLSGFVSLCDLVLLKIGGWVIR